MNTLVSAIAGCVGGITLKIMEDKIKKLQEFVNKEKAVIKALEKEFNPENVISNSLKLK